MNWEKYLAIKEMNELVVTSRLVYNLDSAD